MNISAQNYRLSQQKRFPLRALIYIALMTIIASGLIPIQTARSAGFTVDRFDDDPTATACTGVANDCSLRGAIIASNADAFLDTITLPAGTYTLTVVGTSENDALDGDLDVQGDLTINGADQSTTIINGNGVVTGENVFHLFGGYTVEFNDLQIRGGDSSVGGIVNFATLTLNNVTVSDNHGSTSAGGISTSASLTLENSTISNNTSANTGGGINVIQGLVTITGSTISGNQATGTAFGGGINQSSGTVDISGSQITGNGGYGGGGISSSGGALTITNTLMENNTANTANGGAIYHSGGGALIINDSEIKGNTAADGGGGIAISGSGTTATITGTLINGNIANGTSDGGGGIRHASLSLDITNSTLSGNSTKNNGGGIFTYAVNAGVALVNVTITNNTADSDSVGGGNGGGVYAGYGPINIFNSILAGNSNDQCDFVGGGTLNSSGYNMSSDVSCNLIGTGDQPTTDPNPGLLLDNGGPTATHALLTVSPAIDAGTDTGCPTTDQRGLSRPQGAHCDIGAYERIGPTFSDVTTSHWAYGYIEAIAEAGLSAGFPDGTYRPADFVNRAQMAVFLLKGIHGSSYTPPTPDGSHCFTDISGHWAEAWIEQLYDEGISTGFPDFTYRPAEYVNRAQMAVMLLKAKHGGSYTPPALDGSHPFTDVGGHWAEIWIEQLYDEGITAGYPDGTYRPGDSVNRAQMAVFLVATFGLTIYY